MKKEIATWSKSEVKQFENLMIEHGTDLSLISRLMNKTRDQVLRKFKIMRKLNNNFGFA